MRANTITARCPITVDRLGRPIIGDCLLWTGDIDKDGYGTLYDKDHKNNRKAHRVAFLIAHDRWPEGVLDHLCRVRNCIRATHLEDVTEGENYVRGDVGLFNRSKTHCKRGHPYDEENTYNLKKYPGRACRACNREKWREKNGVPVDAPLRKDRTHCVNGHEWTEENTYWVKRSADDPTLRRQCRACKRERSTAKYLRLA